MGLPRNSITNVSPRDRAYSRREAAGTAARLLPVAAKIPPYRAAISRMLTAAQVGVTVARLPVTHSNKTYDTAGMQAIPPIPAASRH